MIGYTTQASWVLSTAFTVSALDELFRSTTRPAPPGTTPHGVCDPGGPRRRGRVRPGRAGSDGMAMGDLDGLAGGGALIGSRSSTPAPSCCRTASPARSTAGGQALHGPAVRRGRPAPGRPARQDADAAGDQVAFGPSPLRPRRESPWSAVPEVAAVDRPGCCGREMGRDVRLTVWVDAKVKEIDRVQ